MPRKPKRRSDITPDTTVTQLAMFGMRPTVVKPKRSLRDNTPIDPSEAAFLLPGPAVINVSGGRTSAYMLRRHLNAYGGRLPPNVHAVFCNTGDEREETLRFVSELERRWCHIVWLERDSGSPEGFREVSFETASRRAEPFEELIEERQFLPHHGARFCTQELKIEPVRAWMKAQGYEHWTSAVGLRRDEPSRVAKHKERQLEEDNFDSVYPLHRAGVVKGGVMEFWSEQDFDLGLQWWESNCRNCFLKSLAILVRTERDRPGTLAWASKMENQVGGTFVKGRRYLDVIRLAQQPRMDERLEELDPEESTIACNCTDRRVKRCRCLRGGHHGHTLLCLLEREQRGAGMPRVRRRQAA